MAKRINIPKDVFFQKSRWKFYLTIIGLVIIVLTLIFVNFLAQKLKDGEIARAELSQRAYESTAKDDNLNRDITLEYEIINRTNDIPIIVTNLSDEVIQGRNFGTRDNDLDYLTKQVEKLKKQGVKPISFESQKVYYKNSRYYTLLVYFPLFQFLLLMAFIGLGYLGFSTAQKSEQNQVWVGMAKETAHQLGTPISAIMAWIEHLKEMTSSNDPDQQEIITELTNDVNRLNLIADRFSKIGSAPELNKINVYEELDKCRAYMEKRAPRKVNFDFPNNDSGQSFVNINPPLFDWVIENLLRNALDAMEGKGEISAAISEDDDYVIIDITDTGKGIPANKFRTVFQPGFTTKSRGWGLGLSLAKRIIELYHKGKIFVKSSQLNEGTTFTIKLPKAS